jgi:hypothetical protein
MQMDSSEHNARRMALTRISEYWPEHCTIEPGLEIGNLSPVIRDVVERSEDRAGSLAYFLIIVSRIAELKRYSLPINAADIKISTKAAEFIANGEIQRLNQRIKESYGFTPFPIWDYALIHDRFSSGEFSMGEIYDFLEAMQPISKQSEKKIVSDKVNNLPEKQQISRQEWIDRKVAANSHLNGMGQFYARNHYGKLADKMPEGTFTKGDIPAGNPNRGDEFRHLFENLHENKMIYHERFTAVVELTDIKLTDTYFECGARAVRTCTDQSLPFNQPLPIERWTFKSTWEFCSIDRSGRSLIVPYASFILWPGAKLVKKVEALLELNDFEMVETLLWSDLPARRRLR